MTVERVKEIRRDESERAAHLLGAEVRFFDAGDYPLRPTADLVEALVQEYRTLAPAIVLAHTYNNPYNPDHPAANQISLQTRVYAQAEGYPRPGPALGAPPVFMFEPHQPEQCDFKPEVLLDVTPVWERKRQAMEALEAQRHLVDDCSDLSRRRGIQAVAIPDAKASRTPRPASVCSAAEQRLANEERTRARLKRGSSAWTSTISATCSRSGASSGAIDGDTISVRPLEAVQYDPDRGGRPDCA